MPPGDQTGFATVRELYSMKDDLLRELKAMEARLGAKIEDGNRIHDAIHIDMRARADDRHRRIDDYLNTSQREDAVDAALLAGRSGAYRSIVSGLRIANEFRWLIAVVITGLLIVTNGLRLSLSAS